MNSKKSQISSEASGKPQTELNEKVTNSMAAKEPTLELAANSDSCCSENNNNNNQISKSAKRETKNKAKQTRSEENHLKSRSPANGQANSSSSKSQTSRRAQQKGNNNSHDSGKLIAANDPTNGDSCSTLEQFSAKAQKIKQYIHDALEKQAQMQLPDEPIEIVQLKNDILKLSGSSSGNTEDTDESSAGKLVDSTTEKAAPEMDEANVIPNSGTEEELGKAGSEASIESTLNNTSQSKEISPESCPVKQRPEKPKAIEANPRKVKADKKSSSSKDNNDLRQDVKINSGTAAAAAVLGSFEPLLSAKLDEETKYVSLLSSLKKDLEGSPGMLEPICKKLVQMSELISKLQSDCHRYDSENKKLLVIKQKLENLCRELQKSNNAIRIESLDLIKLEQGKAKEQTTKIQSTLSGVIKLFDENQQRNMTLRQENQELQTKLRSLLEHCDNWEKGFATALRQREIENRLVKTELAKANLLKSEEKETFLREKKDLLQLLSMMQEHQSRIEGQEAKLRSDLSNYASRYDECQAVISKGMSKFQTESKRMLKQIEKSKQDYKVLLTKYESSNKRMAQLLDERQRWDKSMNVANKKIETLEKLCRALRDQKSDDSQLRNNSKMTSAKQCNKKDKQPYNAERNENTSVAEVDTSCIAADTSTSHVDDENGKSAGILSLGRDNQSRLDSNDMLAEVGSLELGLSSVGEEAIELNKQ